MAGLTQSAVVKLILEHIGGSKIAGAGPGVVVGAQEIIVKSPAISGVITKLQALGKDISSIRSQILQNPQLATILAAKAKIQSLASTIASIPGLSIAQQAQLTTAVTGLSTATDNFTLHTGILSGVTPVDPFASLDNQINSIDPDRAAATLLAAQQELQRQLIIQAINDGGVDIKTIIKQEITQRVNGQNAIVNSISLLGAVNTAGNAFIFNTSTALVGNGVSLVSQLNTLQANLSNVIAKVSNFADARVDNLGRAFTQAVVQLNSNGYVSGMVFTNNGVSSNLVFSVDNFLIVPPGTPAPFDPAKILFQVGATGIVKMHNIEVDSIKAGSVTMDHLAEGAVGQTGVYYNDNAITVGSTTTWIDLATVTITPYAGKPVMVGYTGIMKAATVATDVLFRIIRNGAVVYGGSTGKTFQAGPNNSVLTINMFDGSTTNLVTVYKVQLMKALTTDQVLVDSNSLICEEQVRVAFQQFNVTSATGGPAAAVPIPTPALVNLDLTSRSILDNFTTGAVVGSVLNATPGSSLSLTSNPGSNFILSGTTLSVQAGAVFNAITTPTITIQITETLAGAIGSPRVSPLIIAIASSATGSPAPTQSPLGALSINNTYMAVGASIGDLVANISGATTGSTLTLVGVAANNRFQISGLTITMKTGSPQQTLAIAVGLVETLAGSSNSPKTTNFTINLQGSGLLYTPPKGIQP